LASVSALKWSVETGSRVVSATLDVAIAGTPASVFVMAHGAGGHMADRGMLAASAQCCRRGLRVVRFNFPYAEAGSRRPDPMPVLKACMTAVIASARDKVEAEQWIIGGRSMGGRAASMLAAEGFGCDALLLLAYPLHPAGQPEKLRDTHLPRIRVPALCVNGTRDPLCRRDLMDAVRARLPASFTMHWLDGADHSFHVLKSTGRTDADVLDEIGETIGQWLLTMPSRTRASPTAVRVDSR
jgi:predicted alpha/beta-hydrolase family hydrolase